MFYKGRFQVLIICCGWHPLVGYSLQFCGLQEVIDEGLKADRTVGRKIENRVAFFLNVFLLTDEKMTLCKLTVFKGTFSQSGALFVMEVNFCKVYFAI